MVGASLPITALVDGESAKAASTHTAGDLIWSEDFQDKSGNLKEGDSMFGFPYTEYKAEDGTTTGAPISVEAMVNEDAAGNKYLHYSTESAGNYLCTQYMYINVPDEAKDAANGEVFTFETDIKLDPYKESTMKSNTNDKYTEYNIGLSHGNVTEMYSAYFTLSSAADGANTPANGNLAINGYDQRKPANVTAPKHKLPTDAAASSDTGVLRPYVWNTYRFVVRKEGDVYYTDVYLNGWYFYRVGQRLGKGANEDYGNFDKFSIAVNLNPGITYGGLSLDNAKIYYGVTEANEAANAKGKFAVDNYDFNDLEAQTFNVADYESTFPILQGANVDHNLGTLRRYRNWGTTLDIKKGVGGKSLSDSSLQVGSGGRINFYRQVNESDDNRNSLLYGTALAEGETLEMASDVMFNSINDTFTFFAETKNVWNRVAIQVTPNYYGHGIFQDPSDTYPDHRAEIIPGLPLNKWIRLKLFITGGTSTTPNTYSIYADNIPIVENAELTYWTVYHGTDTLMGDSLKLGFGAMSFNGTASYDNITFNRYMGGEEYSVDTQVPVILGKNNPGTAMISIRGKVFVGTHTITDILKQFDVDNDPTIDSYIVRDNTGAVVSEENYNQPAGDHYIDILTKGGEHLYVTLAANVDKQNITDAGTGTFGDFALNGITAADSTNAGYGRLADDKSIQLKNSTGTAIRASYTVDSYENNVVEFSFLPDENTNFRFGYDVSFIAIADVSDKADARKNNKGFTRQYPEIMTIANGQISATANGAQVSIGSYKENEWTKIRLVFNHGLDNKVWVSVNEGDGVPVENGPYAYFYKLDNVYLTLPAGGSVIVDDVKITDGAKSYAPGSKIIYTTGSDILLKANTNTIVLGHSAQNNEINAIKNGIQTLTGGETRYIDESGNIVDTTTTNITDFTKLKHVRVANDVYLYYNIISYYNLDCIAIDGNTADIWLVIADMENINNAKLITAVYDSSDGKERFKTCSITDKLTLTADENGVPHTTINNYTAPATEERDIIRYFVWDWVATGTGTSPKLIPLCYRLDPK